MYMYPMLTHMHNNFAQGLYYDRPLVLIGTTIDPFEYSMLQGDLKSS